MLSGRICLLLGETCCLHLQGRILRQRFLQKCSGINARSHSATSQMTVISKTSQYTRVQFGETMKAKSVRHDFYAFPDHTRHTCQMLLPCIWTLPSSTLYLIILHNSHTRYIATTGCHTFLYAYYVFLLLCLCIPIVCSALYILFSSCHLALFGYPD